jgi:hypothetical protein
MKAHTLRVGGPAGGPAARPADRIAACLTAPTEARANIGTQ